MAVQITDEQYSIIWHTLAQIATGVDVDNARLTRDRMITEAREACDALNIKYGAAYMEIAARLTYLPG